MRVLKIAIKSSFLGLVFAGIVSTAPSQAAAQSIATYNLTVQDDWSQANHESWAQPFSEVNTPHFSHLGGGTHNSNLTVWEPGGFSSPGFVVMQEEGWIDKPNVGGDLKEEFDGYIAAGDAYSFLNFPQHFNAGTTTVLSLDVIETHPLVTLVSMLGPTPDWFIGVNGLSMRDGNGWIDTITVDLFVYDGGTRTEDENFALFGTQESPQKAITLLTDTPDVLDPDRTALNSMQIGTFTFELQSVAIPEPTSLTLCGLAALGALGFAWRRRKRAV